MKFLLTTLGILSLGAGIIGAFLPVVPTVPFLLFALYCFTKSSPKLKQKLVSSKIYKDHLEEFVNNRSLPIKKKIIYLLMITTSFTCTAIFLNKTMLTIILVITLIIIYYYFIFRIKNSKTKT